MSSYFDNLVLDLTYLIISYLDKSSDLNKLIDCSEYLKNHFKEDDAWKIMFYSNIMKPLINTNDLWRDNYYNNMNNFTKYKIKILDDWEYLIIHDYHIHLKNLDEFITNFKEFGYSYIFELKFITDNNKVEFIYNFDPEIITTILSEILTDPGIYIGFKIDKSKASHTDIFEFLDNVFSTDDIVTKTFQVNNMTFGYKEWIC